MKRLAIILLSAVCCLGQQASAAEPTKLAFDTYSGYFVSNKFEPDATASFVVISDQEQFDKVFGVAFVMRDTSHRLPKDAFKSLMVVTAIKRGNAVVEFKVESVTEAKGVVEVRYTTTEKKSDTATFACPLIVSIPKGEYKAVQFVENGKPVKKVEMPAPNQKSDTSKPKNAAADDTLDEMVNELNSLGLQITADKKTIDKATGEAAYFMFAERKEHQPRCEPLTLPEGKNWLEGKPVQREKAQIEKIGPLFAKLVKKMGYNEVSVYAADVHYGVNSHANFTLYRLGYRKDDERNGKQREVLLGDADYVLKLP